MADPTPLSPAAQAVLTAASVAKDHAQCPIAAALCAAADQVVPVEAEIDPLKAWSTADWNHMNATKYQREKTRRQLLAIATELKNQ